MEIIYKKREISAIKSLLKLHIRSEYLIKKVLSQQLT